MKNTNILSLSTERIKNLLKANNTKSENEIFFCPVSKLKFDEEYKQIYKQLPSKVSRIAEHMRKFGYDNSQPIIISPDYRILDGYSRIDAINSLNGLITKVPVIIKNFSTRDEYLHYILHLQNDRRSSSDRDKYFSFLNYMELRQHAKENGEDVSEYSEEKLSEKLSVSKRQISMLKEISKKITPDLLEKLESEQYSLNQIYSYIKKSEKASTENMKENKGLHINIESFNWGIKYALILTAKGVSPHEIYNHKRFSDGNKMINFTDEENTFFNELVSKN